ncbi:DUF5808 domain-containing protein [Flavobacterium chilense]|uniref:Uncharacterized protein n=1 Tax=Flavobacterium chilense TaxID=946677 RepID=A0A1M7E0R9_9FLAO|nr:DUF5808 domain-containing protein [Flavobacterium chilense]SHL85351.1 hypothetical protein SAMN05444484_102813 [Flavobacterium chilense]
MMENEDDPTEEEKNKWINDPNNWVWGIFYFNPKDKRLFPPKKIKEFGYTTNFANPNSVFALLILMAVLIILGRFIN